MSFRGLGESEKSNRLHWMVVLMQHLLLPMRQFIPVTGLRERRTGEKEKQNNSHLPQRKPANLSKDGS
jgi:hypothetical protein